MNNNPRNSQNSQNSQTPINFDDPFIQQQLQNYLSSNSPNNPSFSSPPNFQQNLYNSPNPPFSSHPNYHNSPTSFPYENVISSQSPQFRPTRPPGGVARSSRPILQPNIAVVEQDDEEEEQVEDEEEEHGDGHEGLEDIPENQVTTGGRAYASSWSIDEDRVLCMSYIEAGGDTHKGADQKGKHYWRGIMRLYDQARAENPANINLRNLDGLKGRWKRINREVSKFAGIFAEATRKRRSGTNEVDVLNEARAIWQGPANEKGRKGPVFQLEHCWDILRGYPKWNGFPVVEDAESTGGNSSKRSTPEGGSEDSDAVKRRRSKGKAVASNSEEVEDLRQNVSLWNTKDDTNTDLEAEKHRFNVRVFEFQQRQAEVLQQRDEKKFRLKVYNNLMLKQDKTPEEEILYAKLHAEFFKSYLGL